MSRLVFCTCSCDCGLPRWLRRYTIRPQCRTPRFDPWVRKTPWRRACKPTPVFLPGESRRQRSLAGCSPRGRRESGTTDWLTLSFSLSLAVPWLGIRLAKQAMWLCSIPDSGTQDSTCVRETQPGRQRLSPCSVMKIPCVATEI